MCSARELCGKDPGDFCGISFFFSLVPSLWLCLSQAVALPSMECVFFCVVFFPVKNKSTPGIVDPIYQETSRLEGQGKK